MNEGSLFPASSPALLSIVLLILDRLAGVYEASSCFDSHFPNWQARCLFFEIFLSHSFCLLLRTLSSGLRPIFWMNTLILLLLGGSYCLCFLSSSFILDINTLLDSVGFFTKCFFSCAENFGFHEVPLIKLIVLNSWANRIIFRKSFSTTIPCRVLLVFPSRSFGGFDLTFRSFPSWSQFLCEVVDTGLVSFFSVWTSSSPSTVCWRYCLFLVFCMFICLFVSGLGHLRQISDSCS